MPPTIMATPWVLTAAVVLRVTHQLVSHAGALPGEEGAANGTSDDFQYGQQPC